MLTSIWAEVRDGKIVPTEDIPLNDGDRVLITVMPEENDLEFWRCVDQASLEAVWDNKEDDVYAELLKE